jgi:hypothetical protein
MSGDLADLARRLSPGAVVADEGVIEGYRRTVRSPFPQAGRGPSSGQAPSRR